MFFLGGFNTIFPHLIYLSVIWAFLLIGFSGRLNISWAEKLFRDDEQVITASVISVQSLPSIELQTGEIYTDDPSPDLPVTYICNIPGNTTLNYIPPETTDYCGPPAI
jgi:hypothetical protein